MSDAEALNELAAMLEKKARLSLARVAMSKHDATIDPAKENKNCAWCEGMAAVCRRAAEPKKKAKKKPAPTAADETPAFKAFWNAYPRRIGKGNARKAWVKMQCEIEAPEIMRSLEKAKRSEDWTREQGQFIPHPATWLNREGWEDDFTTVTRVLKSGLDTQTDPPGWKEWLQAQGVAYREYWRAMPAVQKDFNRLPK